MESVGSPIMWLGFIAFVLAMLALDLGVFHRKEHVVRFREAAAWSATWVSLALIFNGLVWWWFGAQAATEFLTGYLLEESLSVDNMFVFVLIFTSLGIPPLYQHRVLYWGILTAIVLRATMILAGTAMLSRFHWLIYVFGAFLLFTGIKILLHKGPEGDEESPQKGWAMRLLRRVVPMTSRLHGNRFFTVEAGRRVATPLFAALVLVELSDVVFALDSVPAIFGVTLDPFIVFTSNIFAILGLRSMFFMLSGMVEKFHYLKTGLAIVLLFIGGKMIASHWFHISSVVSLGVVAAVLGTSIVVSLVRARGVPPSTDKTDPDPAADG